MTQPHGRATTARAETAAVFPPALRRSEGLAQRLLIFALVAAVIVVDQAAKWWGWRHVPGAKINPGGDFLTGHIIGRWYADPVAGAVLDLVDFGLVSIAVTLLARRRRLPAVAISGSLMIGGWASNLLDRLAMHYWTAPGSVRGAVDFISAAGRRWNPADFFILGATPVFVCAVAYVVTRAAGRTAAGPAAPLARTWPGAWMLVMALAAAGLIVAVALGAAHPGGLTRPAHSSTQCGSHTYQQRC